MRSFVPGFAYRPKKKHIKMDLMSVFMRKYGHRYRVKRYYDDKFTYRNYYDIWDDRENYYIQGTGLLLFERIQFTSDMIYNPLHPDRLKMQGLADKLNNEERDYLSDILKYVLKKKCVK